MQEAHARTTGAMRKIDERLAGAPISWGACEIPGWGVMPSPDRVLAEMAELGLRGTELGAPGFFPNDPTSVAESLTRYGLELVGGFVALVLHEADLSPALAAARKAARLIAEAGGQMFVAGVIQDLEWSAPEELDDRGWARVADHMQEIDGLVAEYGLTLAVHPHAGTLIETPEQVESALDAVDVEWCLDTGHLMIGGADPVPFARAHGDRIVHAHLKDVDARVAADFRDGRRSLVDATRNGLFLPLGKGDARVAEVMDALPAHGYDGWLVLEQDTAITGDEPTVAGGPMRDALQSIAFLHETARTTEEINR
jgi:inosose dehydratase